MVEGVETIAGGQRNPWLRAPVQIALSYLLVIVAGTVFLSQGFATPPQAPPLTFQQALFTATSATCVTGLTVVNTAQDLSHWGQIIIFALFQLGGIGILSMAFLVFRGIGLRNASGNEVVESTLSRSILEAHPKRALQVVLGGTLFAEICGALCLWPFLSAENHPFWKALFLSVSSFCNAGFDNLDAGNGLQAYAGHPAIGFVLMSLWLAGGLGFLVPLAILQRRNRSRQPMDHTARLALLASAILIPLGAIVIFVCENFGGQLADFSWHERFTLALFQGNTTRTAGFSMLDLAEARRITLVCMIPFMLIGGAPGGTAGGIKTVTILVVLSALWSRGRGESKTTLWQRTLSQSVIQQALWIAVLFVIFHGAFTICLTAFEAPDKASFEQLVFEAASALGTVGLGTGITAELSVASQYTLTLAMFIGRIGALTILLALMQTPPKVIRMRYPHTKVYVG